MDTNVKKLPKAEVEIKIELTEDEFQKYIEIAAENISKEIKIEGFRPGKVPYEVIIKHVGKDLITNHAMDLVIPEVLTNIIKKEKLEVIAKPKVEVISVEPVKIKAITPVYPEVKVNGYEKVKIKLKDVKVDEKDIDKAIENIQKQLTEWEEVTEPIKKGDKVEIDFEGFDEGGAPLEGTKSMNHPLIVGDNMMVPGFEDNLAGLKKDDEKDFTLTFPKDYHKKDYQNKKVKFHVKIGKVQKPKYPEINEEFIEKITGMKKSVDEFRKNVNDDLLAHKKSEERKRQENELLEKFLGITKVEFSDILLDEEVGYMLREMKEDMARRGLKFEQYLEHIKKTEEDIREELKKEALKRITIRFGLHEIMEKENIEVNESEVKEEMKKVPSIKPEQEREMKGRITNSIRISRLFDRFLEK